MYNAIDISTRLKELREKNNYTQAKIAEYLNISRQAISHWETGKASPDLEKLLLLAKLYNISVDDFFKEVSSTSIQIEDRQEKTDSTSSLEVIGLSVILVLSAQFPFVPIMISAFVALWMKKNKRNYPVVYVVCLICLLIGIYNTYIFLIHFMIPNAGTSTIKSI